MRKLSGVERLRQQGFDESYAIPFKHAWKVQCSQCEALCINGVATHEHGCPHIPRESKEECYPAQCTACEDEGCGQG